jgi:hypothetical protein
MRARFAVVVASALLAGSALPACKRHAALQAEGDAGTPDAQLPAPDGGEAGSPHAVLDAGPADDAIPPATSDELTARAKHLVEAITRDDPDLGTDILFPRDGWLATRDAADPGKDWERRVASPFRRSVHVLSHHRADLGRAQQVSIEIGHAVFQVATRKRAWKKPLWTVHGSRLTYVVDGHTRTLTIREMTAWRGAWYVTRLR